MHNLDQYRSCFIIVVIVVVLYFLYKYQKEYRNKSLINAENVSVSNVNSCTTGCGNPNAIKYFEKTGFYDYKGSVENFAQNNLPVFNLYYTDWCGWSQKFLPVWAELEKKVNSSNLKNKVKLEKINCESNKDRCGGVPGFPFIVLNKNGNKINFEGNRDLPTLEGFINKNC